MLNASSSIDWDLRFANGMTFWVIGAEGGLFDRPAETSRLRIGPGERYDVLVDFARLEPGATVELVNHEPLPQAALLLGSVPMTRMMRFRAADRTGFTGPVPATLRGGPGQPPATPPAPPAVAVRNVSLSQPSDVRVPPTMFSLNNLRWSSEQIEMPRQGTVEVWNIVNATPDPHPVHLHLVHVRVLARQAIDTLAMCLRQPQPPIGIKWTPDPDPYVVGPVRAPEPWEAGWKDTVMCDPNSVTRLAVVFPTADELGFDPDATFPAAVSLGGVDPAGPGAGAPDHAPLGETVDRLGGDYVGSVAPPAAHHRRSTLQGYVWHCHILDHEDHDMMLRYRLVP